MDKSLIWKSLVIIIVVGTALLNLYPPKETLNPGIDLAGGTSLIYEIDTTDLAPNEQKDLAQNMIPILLKRIDPTHVANIVMRPQGDTRIEIQLPVASLDTRTKRQAYEQSLLALEEENINLLKIRHTLTLPEDKRAVEFDTFAKGNEERQQILETLARVYDQRRQVQQQRDSLSEKMDNVKTKLEDVGLSYESVQYNISSWAKQTDPARQESIQTYVESNLSEDHVDEGQLEDKQNQAVTLIHEYITLYNEWAPVVNKLTEPDEGLNAQWDEATHALTQLNLNIDLVRDVLDLPIDSALRKEKIENFKATFPKRAGKIEAVVAAYDEYQKVGGRLDDPEDLKRMLKGAGVLEFRILPTTGDGKNTASGLEAKIAELTEKGPKAASTDKFVWCEIENIEEFPASFQNMGEPAIGQFGDTYYVLCSNQTNEKMLHGGEKKWKLKKANPTTDEQGRRAIGFSFDDVAASLFYNITSNNIGRPLCILLDNQAISAPSIHTAIRSSGVITGGANGFTQTEVSDMVNKLNAGSFPARLSEVPILEKTISATIGADNRDDGIRAGLYGLAAVAIFMLGYYLLSGVMADIALILNILLVLGTMAMLQSTFTLPGIAGLILTIGMSVDANVLIFERIREEQKRGSTLKSAISNGYSRAFRTIFDANVTTFGVAAILYMAASEEIKGFAIVLMLGIVASMFTALFVTRVMFDWLTSSRLLTNQLTLPWEIARNSQINWMKLRPLFLTVSAALIICGLGVFFTRDETSNSKYDIEFIGGTSVEIELKEGAGFDRAAVEAKIADYLNPVKVYEVGDSGRQFEINTTLTNTTTALITFNNNGNTAESVTDMIRKACLEKNKVLSNLTVTNLQNNQFKVSTSRVNASLVEDVLTTAVGEQATVSDVEVQEIVSNAVRDAFKNFLAIREDLGLTIVSADRIEPSSQDAVVLADYLGGVKLTCKLEHSVTGEELEARIRDLRFKPDMQEIEWHRHQILHNDLTAIEPTDSLTEFVYVSAHPEAGYRELDVDEWQNFLENEKSMLHAAASLETSLARITQIDPSIGSQAKQRALVAIILSLIAIVGYIWVRFGTARYGFAAIAALVHDVCITLGLVTACTYVAGTPFGNALGIGDFKINLEMVAAFLTIIGYSLNDTIVVFDRIRENRGKLSILTPQMISSSINQTLSRTLLTSFTTFLVVLVMYIWGGEGLRGFTFALLVGILVGTYSSIAIAAPILLLGETNKKSK